MIDGAEHKFRLPEDARRAGVATIYQELLLFPELTVAENIFMGHAPRGFGGRLNWREMRERAERLLKSLEIHDLAADRIVGELSVGNRQRVEILRALSYDAKLLIMDEPTAALTEPDVVRLFKIVRLLKARGVGIIYISHRLDEIFTLADRVTVLRDGAFVGTRNVAQTDAGELVQMMVGRTIENLFPKVEAPIGAPVLEVRSTSCARRQHAASALACGRARSSASRALSDLGAANSRSRFSASRQPRPVKSGSRATRSSSARRARRAISASPTSRRIEAPKGWCAR